MLGILKRFFSFDSPKKNEHLGKLIVSEGRRSWEYHLRKIGEEGPKYGGLLNITALCGAKLNWDTKIHLEVFGYRTEHIPETFCEQCAKIAKGIENGK